ncbi:hypothetical protein B484DRAFT_388983 [Ochromonadaceae sp. CCMP2298]|nr:hypothetical protein B484DRAFT_388983 [Ochromonadaceae sp. CCMP2298]
MSSRPNTAGGAYVQSSARSDRSNLSTNEMLRRMREVNEVEKNNRMNAEIHALGGYNSYSRPKASMDMPLRTVLLDPSVNNFPRSRTRTELLKRIKLSGFPHPSYDLDNDGYVSQQDYKLAKRFDFDGNGVLDAQERQVGKRVLADEFFKRHAEDLHIFGDRVSASTHQQNVDNLVNSYSFERSYDKLKSVERTFEAEGAKKILDCIRSDQNNALIKHNYYANKFDCTAWNDFDAIPRSASLYGLTDHGGSRKRLLFSRRETVREQVNDIMRTSNSGGGGRIANFRRVNMITNPAVENS